MSNLNIGKLAKSCHVNIDTVRYYERKGLLNPVERSESGYRIYDQSSIERLNFIRRVQALGFTLTEIHELLTLCESPEADCADIRDYTRKKIKEIEERILDLVRIKNSLKGVADFCPGKGNPLNKCGILKYYYGENG